MGSFDDMDAEEATQQTQLTQQSTQPTSSRIDGQIFQDVLCLLIPLSEEAKEIVRRLYVYDYFHILACTDTNDRTFPAPRLLPAQEGGWKSASEKASIEGVDLDKLAIALRLNNDKAPRDPSRGFTFGRNHHTCDICVGSSSKLSNTHFIIKLLEDSRALVLCDVSTNGTYIDDERIGPVRLPGGGIEKKGDRFKVLNNGAFIKLFPGAKEETTFAVRIFEENFCEADTVLEDGSISSASLHKGKYIGPNRKYKCITVVGQGSFAVVWKAVEVNTGYPRAIKQIKKQRSSKAAIQKEVDIMQKLSHDNIVNFYEHFEDDQMLSIILEYVPGGDLREFRNKRKEPFGELMVKEIAIQVLKAVDYLHCRGVTHRDLKPENILVARESPLLVKLTDFGLAKRVENDQTFLKTFCGTMLYLAPEAFPKGYISENNVGNPGEKRKREEHDDPSERPPKKKHSYNQSIDIWALGCILFYLLADKHPFECEAREDTLMRIETATFDVRSIEARSTSPVECVDFISRMLQVDPSMRITETEAMSHPYLRDVRRPSSPPSDLSDFEDQIEELKRLSQELSQDLQMSNSISADNSPLGSEHATLRPGPGQMMNRSLQSSFEHGGNATSRAGSPFEDDGVAADPNSQEYQILLNSQVSQASQLFQSSQQSQAENSNGSPMDSQQEGSPMDSQQEISQINSQQGVSQINSQQEVSPMDSQEIALQDGSPMDSQQEISSVGSQNAVSDFSHQESQQESQQGSQLSNHGHSNAPSIQGFPSTPDSASESSGNLAVSRLGMVGSVHESSLSISDLRGSTTSSVSAYYNGGAAFSAYPSSATLAPFPQHRNINSSQISNFRLDSSAGSSACGSDQTAGKIDGSPISNHSPVSSREGSSDSSMESESSSESLKSPSGSQFVRPGLVWGKLKILKGSAEGSNFRCMDRTIAIGRLKTLTIPFENSLVSRRHIAIQIHDKRIPNSQDKLPIVPSSTLVHHVYSTSKKGSKLNGELLPFKVPCRIYDGDKLVLVDEDDTFIGFKCELKYGERIRPPGQPNIVMWDRNASPTASSPPNANRGMDSKDMSGVLTRENSHKSSSSAATAPTKRRLISVDDSDQESVNSFGKTISDTSTHPSRSKRKMLTTRIHEPEPTRKESPSTHSRQPIPSENTALSRPRPEATLESHTSSPAWTKASPVSASALRRQREKKKEKKPDAVLSPLATIASPQRARLASKPLTSSPSRPMERVVRLEDRTDLSFD